MDQYKETFETWNKVAQLYQEKFMNLDLYNDTYDFICKNVAKQNAKILEIGCGPGNITKYLLSRRQDFDILGIDFAPNMIRLAKIYNPTAQFAVMDCRHISEFQTKFDAIIAGFCLPYLSQTDTIRLISDCYYLLNENGLLYLSFVAGDPNLSGYQVASTGDRTYFYYHSLDKLIEQLQNNKFDNTVLFEVEYQKSDCINEIHSILTATKKS